MSFEAGQRVRCVNDKGWSFECGAPAPGPAFGAISTIVEIRIAPDRLDEAGRPRFDLRLREFPPAGRDVLCYPAEFFRPLGEAEFARLAEIAADPPAAAPARELAEAAS